jgi:hypothetical protein
MKPKFLDNPPRYTRASREASDPVQYACAVSGVKTAGYPRLWYFAVVIIGLSGLLFSCKGPVP